MKPILFLLMCIIFGLELVVIAILSVQNATLVYLTFLNLQSIKMPLGVVLAMSAGVGLFLGGIIQLFSRSSQTENY